MSIQECMDDVTSWADNMFPEQSTLGKLSHLREEVLELQVAVDNDDRAGVEDELADCYLLLFNVSKRLGYTEDMIKKAVVKKLNINKRRKWGRKGQDGQIYHIK